MRRLITAAVLVPLILGAIFGLANAAFAWVVVVVVAACSWEFARVNRLLARSWIYALLIAGLVAVVLGLIGIALRVTWWPVVIVLIAAAWVLSSRSSTARRASVAVMASFGVVYFLLAAGALVQIHAVDSWLVLLLVAMVALADSAAYYAGRAFGRRQLAPEISPNKTWAGALASALTGLSVAAGWALWRGESVSLWLLVGLAVNLAAQAGDLLQSAFKREAGVKDSSDLLPGHGGVWDRTDAILLAAPVFALLIETALTAAQ